MVNLCLCVFNVCQWWHDKMPWNSRHNWGGGRESAFPGGIGWANKVRRYYYDQNNFLDIIILFMIIICVMPRAAHWAASHFSLVCPPIRHRWMTTIFIFHCFGQCFREGGGRHFVPFCPTNIALTVLNFEKILWPNEIKLFCIIQSAEKRWKDKEKLRQLLIIGIGKWNEQRRVRKTIIGKKTIYEKIKKWNKIWNHIPF